MLAVRPIPRNLLPDSMVVFEPTDDGGYGEPKTVRHVRFERAHEAADDAHRSDAIGGKVFVDAVTSAGAFEVAAGSRIEIDGVKLLVKSCARFAEANGRVHHWELAVA